VFLVLLVVACVRGDELSELQAIGASAASIDARLAELSGENGVLQEQVAELRRDVFFLTATALGVGLIWGAITWRLMLVAKDQPEIW